MEGRHFGILKLGKTVLHKHWDILKAEVSYGACMYSTVHVPSYRRYYR